MQMDDMIPLSILKLATCRGADKTICPSEVARDVAGNDESKWRPLMATIKAHAQVLATDGKIVIKKRGNVIDHIKVEGIYRIAIAKT